MKKIYRTDDGIEFETETECIAYESDSKPSMWNANGESTNAAEDAKYLYLQDKNAAKMFLHLCTYEDEYAGIDDEAYGFFCWDEFDESYDWIDAEELTLIWELMHKVCPGEFMEENK